MLTKTLESWNQKLFVQIEKLPGWLYYCFFIVLGFFISWFFFPIFYTILIGLIFSNFLKFIPKNIKLGIWIILLALMLVVNYFYLINLFHLPISQRYLFGENWYYFFYWIVEISHFSLFVTFFYSCYRIIRYEYTPCSSTYVGLYVGTHVLYNACPISATQNYLLDKAGLQTGINTFWNGLFAEKSELVRLLFGFFCTLLFFTAYLQLKKIKLKKTYWFSFWLEHRIGRQELSKKYYY